MAKVRVPIYGAGQQRVAVLDTAATQGAVVGVDLRWPDGTLVDPAQWTPAPDAGAAQAVVGTASVQALPVGAQTAVQLKGDRTALPALAYYGTGTGERGYQSLLAPVRRAIALESL